MRILMTFVSMLVLAQQCLAEETPPEIKIVGVAKVGDGSAVDKAWQAAQEERKAREVSWNSFLHKWTGIKKIDENPKPRGGLFDHVPVGIREPMDGTLNATYVIQIKPLQSSKQSENLQGVSTSEARGTTSESGDDGGSHEMSWEKGIGKFEWVYVMELPSKDRDFFIRDKEYLAIAKRLLGHQPLTEARKLLEKDFTNSEAALAFVQALKCVLYPPNNAAIFAVHSLRQVEGEKALPELEIALSDKDAEVRAAAASVLGQVGGEKALAMLEKALADQDSKVRVMVAHVLGSVGGKKALGLLEKALADQDWCVRYFAVSALGQVRGEMARDILLQRLDMEPDRDVMYILSATLRAYFSGDPVVEQALQKLKKP